MKQCLMLCVLLLAVTFAAGAQGTPTLGVTAAPLKVDGVFGDKEYSLVSETVGMKLGLTWTADTLFVGMGGADSIVSMHKARASVAVDLAP